MKFSNTIVLGALTLAASSPTITAAPFPSDAGSAAGGNGGNTGAPSLSSSIGAGGGHSAVTSPDPDGALSPRSRAVERFGMAPVQKRNSLRTSKDRRDGKPLGRRQLLPNLAGLGLNANQLAGLQGGAGSSPLSGLGLNAPALSGLGLGGLDSLTGTANSVLSQAQGLLAPATGLVNGATGALAPVGSVLNGLTGDLPLVGPLLNQVQTLTGLNNLLGNGAAVNQQTVNAIGGLGSGGVSKLASLQNLNAQLLQQELLSELSALSSGNTGSLTNNLQGLAGNLQQSLPLPSLQNPLPAGLASLGSLQGLAGQVQGAAANVAQGLPQPLQGVAGQAQPVLAGVNGLANQAQALAGDATQALPQPLQAGLGQAQSALAGLGNLQQVAQDPGAGLNSALTNGLPSVPDVGQLPANLAGVLPAPLAGTLPNNPVPNLPLPALPILGSLDPATLQALTGGNVANLQGFRNKLAVPDAGDPQSAAADATEGVASATQSATSTLPISLDRVAPSYVPEPAYQSVASAINLLPSLVVSLESTASAATSSAVSSASSLSPPTPVSSGSVNLQRRDGERLTPAGASRKVQDDPNAQGLPDAYDESSDALAGKQPPADVPASAAGPSESIVADVQSIISSVESAIAPVPTNTADSNGNPLTYLAPPLTAEPTQDPANINFNTDSVAPGPTATSAANSAPAPIGSGSSAQGVPTASAASARKYRRDAGLPDPAQPQAPLSDAGNSADQAIDQSGSSHLQPLAPAVAPLLHEFVAGLAPPSPAQSFHSAFSTPPLSPSPTSSDWSLPSDSAIPLFDVGKDAVKFVSADAGAGSSAIPSPYPGWSQDTVYSNVDKSAAKGNSPAIQPTPASNLVKPIGLGRFAKLRRQRSQPSPLEEVKEDQEESAYGDVFSESRLDNIKIDPHAETDAAGAPSRPANGVSGPPSNWSQDSVYKHPASGGSAKPAALGGNVPHLISKRSNEAEHLEQRSTEHADPTLLKRGGRPPLVRARAYTPQDFNQVPPVEKRMRMVRFARYTKVRRDGDEVLENVHQPPAGEHGQPPAAVKAVDVAAPSSSAASESAQPEPSSRAPHSQTKTAKKRGSKKHSNEKSSTSAKKSKGKKKEASKEPAPSAAPEEPAASEPAADAPEAAAEEPAARMRKRSLLRRLSLRRWI